jgi:rsbT antagonist protein RsbS
MDRIPILKMGDFLLVTIQVDMHDQLASALQDDLTTKIARFNAKGVLIDISSLDIVDSFIGRMLANTSAMARVLDAQTVVVGMQPAVTLPWLSSDSTWRGPHSGSMWKRDGDVALPHWHPRSGRGYRCSRLRQFRLPLREILSRYAMQFAGKR